MGSAKLDLISLLVNNFFLPQSKMLRQISLMRLTLPPSRKIILHKTLQKNVSLRSISTRAQYAAYFKTLDLPISATKEEVRRRYIELAKQHHPDAGADGAEEFAKVDAAYKGLQKKFKEDEEREKAMEGEYGLYYQEKKRRMEEEDEDKYPHITHVIPQHRQFLDNGGFGVGTPAQRQKQAQKYRAFKANEAVFERRMGQLTAQYEDRLVTAERDRVKAQKTKNQMERLVEDLIQEGMANGAFDNLAGAGKPLPERPPDFNPYMDFTTHKMNQILVETGFAPEWVELQKEIRLQSEALRKELSKCRQSLGPAPLSEKNLKAWKEKVAKMEKNVVDINKKIQKFNLIVPSMHHQKFPVNLEKEAEKVFENGFDPKLMQEEPKPKKRSMSVEKPSGLFSSLFSSLFNKS